MLKPRFLRPRFKNLRSFRWPSCLPESTIYYTHDSRNYTVTSVWNLRTNSVRSYRLQKRWISLRRYYNTIEYSIIIRNEIWGPARSRLIQKYTRIRRARTSRGAVRAGPIRLPRPCEHSTDGRQYARRPRRRARKRRPQSRPLIEIKTA